MTTSRVVVTAALLASALPLSAQWTNRYQRIGQGHHVYVEGYDFPTYSVGPTYPAVSADGATQPSPPSISSALILSSFSST